MTKKRSTILAGQVAWQPTLIRLSAFTIPSNTLPQQDWWNEIVNVSATTTSRALEQTYEAPFQNGKLTLSIAPFRIDWRFGVNNDLTEDFQFATLGSYDQNISIFTELMMKWLKVKTIPPLMRLAFGSILLLPTETALKGYEILRPLLHHVELDLPYSSDLLYQINRPRLSETNVSDLKINRLSKWAVIRRQATLTATQVPNSIELPEAYAAHLELDINTPKEYRNVLPAPKLPKLFTELVNLGKEIAEKGDVK